MSTVLEKPIALEPDKPAGQEHRYRELSDQWPDHRVELIDGRIVVRELPTIDHARTVFWLLRLLMAVVADRGWEVLPEISLFLGPQYDRYRPDLTFVPADP